MRFGKINNLIIIGGEQRLVNLIKQTKRYNIIVITAERLLKAKLSAEGITLQNYLNNEKIQYYSVDDINQFNIDEFVNENTLGISIGSPFIFNADIISKFNKKFINGHGSKLPQDRGGGGYSWQILRGLNVGYHLFHLIDKKIDTGNIIFVNEFIFPAYCRTPKDYKDYFMESEIIFLNDFFKKIECDYDFKEIFQQEYFSSYFPRLSTLHHAFINWSWNVDQLERFICAFDSPYKGASTFLNGKRIFLKKARKENCYGSFHPFMSGLVYRKSDTHIYISVSDSSILVEEVLNEENQNILKMIKVGQRFVTPIKYLDEALAFKAVYTPRGLKGSE